MQRIERTFAGRRLVIETGRMAKQAAGSAVVQFGETMVLAAVTVSDTESPLPFFPLLVEYKDKAYAAGKIPGGFIKREGRPSDPEILKARIIDRSIRPLFPEGFKNEVQVFIYVVSADQENDADVMALVAASYAINSSKIPFMGTIAGVRVGRVQEKWILNPTFQQLPYSDMDVVLAASKDSIMMVEGGALEVSEADMIEALSVGQRGIQELIGIQEELLKQGRADKMEWKKAELGPEIKARVEELAKGKIGEALNHHEKHTRIGAIELVKKEAIDKLLGEFPDNAKDIHNLVGDVEYHALRSQVLDTGKRVDGRGSKEVRPITIDAQVLPRAHGSSLFTRGQTQALVAVTLGTANDVQRLDSIDEAGETTKSFMLHYNFPPFSTGEVRPMRGTSRREIGHGNLAERALQGPRADLSPYAPRIVTMTINPEKIGDLIGPKGKTIRGIQEETGAEITVDDTGLVTIAAVGGEAMERARQMVQALTAEPVIGETYEGTVKSTTAFGAFVEIMPGTEGLVHISELKHGRTEKTEDVVKKGDRVKVKLLERDERGRLRLSMKALVPKPEGGAFGDSSAEGTTEGETLAAVGAQTEGDEGGNERPDRGSSERGDRPRGRRGGSRGARNGGRSRE